MSGTTQTMVIDNATPALRAIRERTRSGVAEKLVATACRDHTMRHLTDLNGSRTRGGGKGFYEQAASKVQSFSQPGYVLVSVKHQGLAQRFYGGRIEPTVRKCLAFPVGDSPAASAGRTNELSGGTNLRAIFFQKTTAHAQLVGALISTSDRVATGVYSTGKRKGETKYAIANSGTILFLLAAWVDQNPDPTVMPSAYNYKVVVNKKAEQIARALLGRN